MAGSTFRIAALAILLASGSRAQVTQLVSINSNGSPMRGGFPAMSADGRFVAYMDSDVFVRDRQTGTTEQLTFGAGIFEYYASPSISADGRFVTFATDVPNLVADDTNDASDIFVHDRLTHSTERVSVTSAGRQGNGDSYHGEITPDGRFVVFDSEASNLVDGDGNGDYDVFVRDRQAGTTERISITSAGSEVSGPSYLPSISADGRFVGFASGSTDFFPGDTNQVDDVFLRDRLLGTTEHVSVGLASQHGWYSVWFTPSISADGRYIAFDWSLCDECGRDLYVRDRQRGITELVSVNSHGEPGNGGSYGPCISPDGRFVAFDSDAGNLVPGDDVFGSNDTFIRDRLLGTTERVSVDWAGRPGNDFSGNGILSPPCRNRITPDARYVAFYSIATNLVPSGGSANGAIYVRDRFHEDHPSLCSPGFSGVIDCPCANSPSSRDRGCDNSSASGGARLEVGGGEYISSDSLFFTITGATPNALCLLFQGTRASATGAVFGQGVRCTGGTLTNLYATSTRRDGSVFVPDFDVGEPIVHQRAIAAGDPIPPMHARWYMALYRDPVVLGGCPASSTFNATPTREVLWLP